MLQAASVVVRHREIHSLLLEQGIQLRDQHRCFPAAGPGCRLVCAGQQHLQPAQPGLLFFLALKIAAGQLGPAAAANQAGRHLGAVQIGFVVDSAAPARLEQFKHLVAAHLQVTPAGLGKIGRIRPVQHIHAVLPVLHAQAQMEAGVAPDVGVNGAAGLLGSQDQMDSQAPAHLGHADQLGHELGLFPLEFSKLIDDDEQVGHRDFDLSVFVQSRIEIDAVDPVFAENTLPAQVFTLDGNHRPLDLSPGQIGDFPQDMGQVGKQLGHAAALVVDEEKAHVLRAEVQSQRENVSLQGL